MKSHDPVNSPKHYTQHPSGVECIEITRHMNFNLGNVMKYIWREGGKGVPLEDLKKAAWYLNDEIQKREGKLAEIAPNLVIRLPIPIEDFNRTILRDKLKVLLDEKKDIIRRIPSRRTRNGRRINLYAYGYFCLKYAKEKTLLRVIKQIEKAV